MYWHGLTLDGTYEPFVPARTYGPPENCYPAEGGYAEDCRIVGIECADEFTDWLGDNDAEIPSEHCDSLDSLLGWIETRWEEEISECVAQYKEEEDSEGPDPDSAWDSRYD